MNVYSFKDEEECATVIGKALNLPFKADAYDCWCYDGLLSDLRNLRGDEWLECVEELEDKQLIKAFKKFIHYKKKGK